MTKPESNWVVPVLDKGYVRIPEENNQPLIHGSDLSIVNAARASFMKESTEFSASDEKLIKYLIRKNEWSPFRHSFITFEISAPLMVARQWFKYVVGSDHTMDSWNETSRRYVTLEPDCYIPAEDEWRSIPEDKKQGSGANLASSEGKVMTKWLLHIVDQGIAYYQWAMESGVCAEQARLFLPAYGMYTTWRWTGSINSVCWFMKQRLDSNSAQDEIVKYAEAVQLLTECHFPNTAKWFKEYNA